MKKNNMSNSHGGLKLIRGGADKMPRAATLNRSSASMFSSDYIYENTSLQEDELLANLKESGRRLSTQFDFSDESINKAIKDTRRECWKL